ncbi:MAG TPA: helix-turn-helix transcriptional regulator [Gemmatimonadaceae bacterium]|nr:helix-turn-helix transcriptional regulator [Gemmatimonadaceae bacterium]
MDEVTHGSPGERLRSLRTGQGMSLEDLAEKVGVSKAAVAKWELGGAVPGVHTALAVALVLGVEVEVIWPPTDLHDEAAP